MYAKKKMVVEINISSQQCDLILIIYYNWQSIGINTCIYMHTHTYVFVRINPMLKDELKPMFHLALCST